MIFPNCCSVWNFAFKMKEVIEWYCNFTTLGGFSQMHESKSPFSKLFWMFLTVLGLVMTFWGIERAIADYLVMDVTVAVDVKSNGTLLFPTVTVCNENRVHCGQLLTKIILCDKVGNGYTVL